MYQLGGSPVSHFRAAVAASAIRWAVTPGLWVEPTTAPPYPPRATGGYEISPTELELCAPILIGAQWAVCEGSSVLAGGTDEPTRRVGMRLD